MKKHLFVLAVAILLWVGGLPDRSYTQAPEPTEQPTKPIEDQQGAVTATRPAKPEPIEHPNQIPTKTPKPIPTKIPRR